MAENNAQTINEEAGLPDNFVPVDAPPIIPAMLASPTTDGSSKYLQGSLPPGFQHDTSFTGTAYRQDRASQLSLMPLGIQGNPSSNAAIQSTSQTVTEIAVAAIPTPKPAAPSVGDGLIHGDTIWEIDDAYVLLRDDFISTNQGSAGTFSASFVSEIPWYFNAPQSYIFSGPFPNIGNLLIPNNGSSNGAGFLIPNSAVQDENAFWPLLDYPPWKLVWNFSLGRPYVFNAGSFPIVGFSLAKTSLYIGLGNNPNNMPLANGTNPPRPPFFVGLRFDTDPTAPAISDSVFVFEAVANNAGMGNNLRSNTQGSTFSTGIAPVEGVNYRLEMLCTTVGSVKLTLFTGTTSVSATLVVPAWSTGASTHNIFTSGGGIGLASTVLPSGTVAECPVGAGSIFSISGTSTTFDATWTALGVGNASFINFVKLGTASSSGASSTVSGNPALFPYVAFGNDTTATPTANSKALLVDYFAFVWNPGVGGGTGTPDPNKSRYF